MQYRQHAPPSGLESGARSWFATGKAAVLPFALNQIFLNRLQDFADTPD